MSKILSRRGFLKAVGATLALPGPLAARQVPRLGGGCIFFFVQVSDPQLYFGPAKEWERAVSHVNRLGPAFMIVTGDLVHAAGDPAKIDKVERENMAGDYLDIVHRLDKNIALYQLAGNHDVGDTPTRETLDWYKGRFGELWYSFTHKRCLFIILESNILKYPQGAPEVAAAQMSWLEQTLSDSGRGKYLHKIVCLHHPLCLERVDEDDDYLNMSRERRAELLNLFHNHGVSAVFSGHYHRNAYVTDGGIELITTSSAGKALGDDPLGFRIVTVYPDRIEHAYFAYEQMPEEFVCVDECDFNGDGIVNFQDLAIGIEKWLDI